MLLNTWEHVQSRRHTTRYKHWKQLVEGNVSLRNRSESGVVLMGCVDGDRNMTATHGFQGAVCIGGVPCPDSPRLVRNDVSLSYLPLAIGQLPSDLSPAATPEPRPGMHLEA